MRMQGVCLVSYSAPTDLSEHVARLIVVYFRSWFCENISNEVRMTLININILVPSRPGLVGRP